MPLAVLAPALLLTTLLLGAPDPAPRPEPGAPAAPEAPAAPFVPGVSDRQVSEALVSASPADVWRILSTPEGFKALGPAQCEMDFRVGGLIRTHYDPKGALGDERTIVNRVLAYEPERMLTIQIDKPPKGFPFMNVYPQVWTVMTLTDAGTPDAPRTHVRLCGLGYTAEPESQKMRAFFQTGNDWVMQKLVAHFDKATGAPTRAAHAHDPLAPIVIDQIVDAPRADVWTALTTPAGWKSFLGATVNMGSTPGSPFEVSFNDAAPAGQRGSEGCTVLTLLPGRVFSHSWNAPPKFEWARAQRTWCVVTLDDAGPGRTRVHFEHLGFADLAAAHPEHAAEVNEVRAYFTQAWPRVYGALADHFKKPEKQASR